MAINNLIILGNGFDKAHNLPTSYEEFITNYLSEYLTVLNESKTDSHKDDFIESNIRKRFYPVEISDLKSINDFHDFTHANKKDLSIRFVSPYINELLSSNLEWWKDIENFYYEKLKEVVSNRNSNTDGIESLNKFFESIIDKLENYLSKNIKVPHNVANVMRSGFYDLFSKLNRGHNQDSKILVLNFNYTDTIRLYQPFLGQNCKVVFIHGSLGSSDKPLLMGYGDINDPYFEKIHPLDYRYKRYLKDSQYNMNNNQADLIEFLNQSQFNVNIIGHSCGKSDSFLFDRIFNHSNFKRVSIYYHSDQENYWRINQSLRQHFQNQHSWSDNSIFDEKKKCPQFDLQPVIKEIRSNQ